MRDPLPKTMQNSGLVFDDERPYIFNHQQLSTPVRVLIGNAEGHVMDGPTKVLCLSSVHNSTTGMHSTGIGSPGFPFQLPYGAAALRVLPQGPGWSGQQFQPHHHHPRPRGAGAWVEPCLCLPHLHGFTRLLVAVFLNLWNLLF